MASKTFAVALPPRSLRVFGQQGGGGSLEGACRGIGDWTVYGLSWLKYE